MSIVSRPIVLCFLYTLFIGCQSTKEYSYLAQDVASYRDKRISSVTLRNGEIYKYNEAGGLYYEDRKDTAVIRKIVGTDAGNQPMNIDLDKILEVQCNVITSDGTGTVLTVLLVVGIVGVLVLLESANNTPLATF